GRPETVALHVSRPYSCRSPTTGPDPERSAKVLRSRHRKFIEATVQIAATGHRINRGVVDDALAVELAQPVQGERWPGAIAQQPLARGAVSGLDARAKDQNSPATVSARNGAAP
ncbi:MAG TPA: hypothetical protein VLM36_07530, partial [Sphingomicrobium sp.]|nr:hypothetical protein [Sphingomicrobium sp.]